MKKRIIIISLLLLTLNIYAQQTLTKIDGWNAYVHLPGDYDQTTIKYPVIIFIPGIGEVGTYGPALLTHGPSNFIASGNKMEFTVNGQLVKPIVISLQPVSAWPSPDVINRKLDSIVKRWRVDENRIHLTGLSMGGWTIEYYVDNVNNAYTNRIASIVPMSAPPPDNGINNMLAFAYKGGKWWGFEGTQDNRFMDSIYHTMNRAVSGSARYTNYVGGHCCWNTFYNPSWTDSDGESIYTWMLKQSKEIVLALDTSTFTRPTFTVKDFIFQQTDLLISISSSKMQLLNYELYDITGRKIKSGETRLIKGNNEMKMPVSLPAGIYIFRMYSYYNSITKKIVIR